MYIHLGYLISWRGSLHGCARRESNPRGYPAQRLVVNFLTFLRVRGTGGIAVIPPPPPTPIVLSVIIPPPPTTYKQLR
jgi:hypothetical protein